MPASSKLLRIFQLALAASLGVSAALFFVWSWRWPLVGDASLIHYIVWLMEGGWWVPYRNLGDMNMPGSYLIELGAMHVFGMGALGWRLFDFTLVLAAAVAFAVVCWRSGLSRVGRLLAAVFAAGLFIVIHGRDGLAEGGQRDLTMAVCLIGATAFLFLAVRREWVWAAAAFGLLSGIAETIKPTSLPLTLVQLVLAIVVVRRMNAWQARSAERAAWRYGLAGLAGYLVGPCIAAVFLWRELAITAFWDGLHGVVPYYASLGHKGTWFVLVHSVSPILALVVVWLVVVALRWRRLAASADWERWALLAGVIFGLGTCLVQQRALPYYRYPLLAFLLPLIALDMVTVMEAPARSGRAKAGLGLALAGLALGGFFLAPQSAAMIHRYRWWETDFISSLEARLEALGGKNLSGHIQCIDSISGCGNVLYRMRLEPATGVLSDFLLFGNSTDAEPPGQIAVIRETRMEFLEAMESQPPKVIVVTSHLHMEGPENFGKLDRWPEFRELLNTHYRLDTEWHPARTARWWSREETPASYRVYVLREDVAQR